MSHVHVGIWTDWSHGRILGATLTLSKGDGAVLLSFIATFVTIATARLWRIVSYIGHQLQAQAGEHDALYFQRQSILRNVSTPYGAAWMFLLQWWHWKKHTKQVARRTLPWLTASLLFALGSAAAAILSSQISSSTTKVRLLRSPSCGIWIPDDNLQTEVQANEPWLEKQASDSRTAISYAKACYGQADSPTSAACTTFARANITYTTKQDISCPFENQSVCLNNLAFEMESQSMDSHADLGINAPPQDRLDMRMKTTCFPLRTIGYWSYVDQNQSQALGWPDKVLVEYSYGSLLQGTESYQNYTFQYNIYERAMGNIYSVSVLSAEANGTTGWVPTPEIFSETADTTLTYITFGSIYFASETKDPIFNATLPFNTTILGVNTTLWEPARWVAPLLCTHQYQLCDPIAENCTSWVGRRQLSTPAHMSELPMLNDAQRATYTRLVFAAEFTTFYDLVNPHRADALQASQTVNNLQQLDIPDTQWQIEVQSWFEMGLAALQRAVQEYAVVPPPSSQGPRLFQPWLDLTLSTSERSVLQKMCWNQRSNANDGTLSFSVIGLVITLTVGGFVILVSLLMEEIFDYIRTLLHRGRLQSLAWVSDANLNMQQQLLECKAGMVGWQDLTSPVPTTSGEIYASSTAVLLKDEQLISPVHHSS